MRKALLAAAAIAASFPFAAHAKPLPTRQFKAKDAVTLSPAKAYLLVRLDGGYDLQLLRASTPSERADYIAQRTAALAKARRKYVNAKAGYDLEVASWNKADASDRAMMVKPVRPVEPTDANLAFPSIHSDKFVEVWTGRVFDTATGARLLEVQPGTYQLYGNMLRAANGSYAGFCLCMGSVQFEAAAGTITDMGTIRYPLNDGVRDKVKPSWNGLTPGHGGLTAMRVDLDARPVPTALAALPRVPAPYRAAGKIDNFFGLMIQRLTALPGVLAYKRDEVIDVRSGKPVGNGQN